MKITKHNTETYMMRGLKFGTHVIGFGWAYQKGDWWYTTTPEDATFFDIRKTVKNGLNKYGIYIGRLGLVYMIKNEMKVFAINDCDWVAARSFKAAKKWYMKEYDVSADECDDTECNIDTEGMHIEWDWLSDEDKLNEQEIINEGETLYVRKNYRWVIENQYAGIRTPYLIATTEY